ncbi:MAG: FAD/NAD(P)-binding protein [Anaerolineales bacterium]|nr:FAD/NAD(P)-binding protein [Anaerolineales bacterium]
MLLQENSRVCIIGGGPAGCFAAIHLLERARAASRRLDVRIFDPRFVREARGAASCKGCAGIVSANALLAMESIGLQVPPKVIQETIEEYRVHILGKVIRLPQPRPGRRILSVYRGRGPRIHAGEPIESFDAFLLAEARARGAVYVPEQVRSVGWQAGPVVHTDSESTAADLVVVAHGVNSRPVLDPVYGYVPPPVEIMAQDEIPKPPGWPAHTVAAFFGDPKGLLFGVLVPKRDYLNVSLLGHGLGPDPIGEFFRAQRQPLSEYLPAAPESRCGCGPRVPLQAASRFFGDRWVAVGDSAVARLYKDGIHSAFITSRLAMDAALREGVSASAFESGYAPGARRIAADNRYGELLFGISNTIMKNTRLASAFLYSLRLDERRPEQKKILARTIWGMLTGDESYRDLFRMTLRPRDLADWGRDALRRRWRAARMR